VADLRVEHLDLGDHPVVRLHGVAAPVRWTDSLTITRPSPSSLR
jgi:hypothetical protein